jgi:hypothetical protein
MGKGHMHTNYRIIENPDIEPVEELIIKLVKNISNVLLQKDFAYCSFTDNTEFLSCDYYYFSYNQNYFCIAVESNEAIDNNQYFTKLLDLTEFLRKYNHSIKISEPFEIINTDKESYNLKIENENKKIIFYSNSTIKNIFTDYPDKYNILDFCAKKKTKLKLSVYLNQLNSLEHKFFLETEQNNFLVSLFKHGENYYMEIQDQLNNPVNLNALGLQVVLGEILITHDDLLKLKKNCQIELTEVNNLTGFLQLPDQTKLAKVTINWDGQTPKLTITEMLLGE